MFAVLLSRWHILALLSRFWYTADMNKVLKTCAIPHVTIVQSGNCDGHMGTTNIVSVDQNEEMVPIRTNVRLFNKYEAAVFL